VGEAPIPGIEGVRLLPLTAHEDRRGAMSEMFRRDWIPGAAEMVQANLSFSRAGVLRGLHFHRQQADYWCVLNGTAFIGLFDLRSGSPTEGRKAELRVAAELGRSGLYIPRGVAHGFLAETDLMLLYLVDRVFDGTDEFGVAWNDPHVGIAWPTTDPVLSDRDRGNPPVVEVAGQAPAYQGNS
jgi:dTDP-4-dehydrorhamnose 3,5-epimerase